MGHHPYSPDDTSDDSSSIRSCINLNENAKARFPPNVHLRLLTLRDVAPMFKGWDQFGNRVSIKMPLLAELASKLFDSA
jgi:hypothetical protein